MGQTQKVSARGAPKSSKAPAPRAPRSTQAKYESALREMQRLTKEAIPDERRKAVMPLLHNAAFMKVKLDEARASLMGEQLYTRYDNGGGQSGIREHPGFSAYNKLLTTFARVIKQITDLMPSGAVEADALTEFINDTRLR